jgi:hypothetical protein
VRPDTNDRIAKVSFASVYPHYVSKIERKGRTVTELNEVIQWLTGYDEKSIQLLIEQKVSFEEFFDRATLNPNVDQVTGVICGIRIEDINNPLTKKVRVLDKLVDDLAKGKIRK